MKEFVISCDDFSLCILSNSDIETSIDYFVREECSRCINGTIVPENYVHLFSNSVKSEFSCSDLMSKKD